MFDIIFLLPFIASMGLFSFYTSKSVRSLINEYKLYPERKKRDIHTELVPSSIGVGFLIVFTCGTIFYQNEFLNVIDYSALIISAAGITVLGYLDDLNALSSPPVNWYRMGDGDTAPTLTDNGSGGNNGTMSNFSTFSTDVPT